MSKDLNLKSVIAYTVFETDVLQYPVGFCLNIIAEAEASDATPFCFCLSGLFFRDARFGCEY